MNKNCDGKKLNEPFESNRKFKKLQVCVKDKDKIKNIHFGDKRYSDFTIHKDEKRRENFRARHRCNENPSKLTARYWACEELW
jgi:hypothetical protein